MLMILYGYVIVCAAAVLTCAVFVRGRLRAGSILFRSPDLWRGVTIDLATVTLLLLLGGWWLRTASVLTRPSVYLLMILYLTFALRAMLQPHSRIQVHEHGVYLRESWRTRGAYIPWERLGAYRFCPDNTLVLQYRGWRTSHGFPSDVTVPYLYHQRGDLDALLTAHLPQRYPQAPVSA